MQNAVQINVNRSLYQEDISTEKTARKVSSRAPVAFSVFLAWTFVLIGRPQDVFIFLAPLRPALILGLITIIIFLLQRSRFREHPILKNTQGKLFVALVFVMISSVPFAYYRGGAFWFLANVYMNAIMFFIIFYKVVDLPRRIEQVLFTVCMGVGLYSLFALQRGISVTANRLAFGDVFDPNDLAFFAISFLPYNFLFVSKTNPLWKRLMCSSNLIINTLLILRTGSRGGFLALCIVICAMFFRKTTSIRTSYKIIFVMMGFIIVLLNTSVIDFSRLSTVTQIQNDYNMFDETGRMAIWKRGFELMLRNPFTGVGVSCFGEAIGRDRANQGIHEIWQAPHNSLIQIGTETGVIGLILFLLISYRAFMIFRQVKNKTNHKQLVEIAELSRIGFLGHFVSSMFLSQAYSIHWVFIIALSASIEGFMKWGLLETQNELGRYSG